MTYVKIDLDGKVTPCRWAKWCERAASCLALCGIDPRAVEMDVRRSPSGGAHIRLIIGTRALAEIEVVALQAILGSDPLREALNLGRTLRGEPANVLHTHRDGAPWGEPWPGARLTWKRTVARSQQI